IRLDMTLWREDGSDLDVPRASLFTHVGGRWLFVQHAPAPSADPSDYIEPPITFTYAPGNDIVAAPLLTDGAQTSPNVVPILPKIATLDLSDDVSKPALSFEKQGYAAMQP